MPAKRKPARTARAAAKRPAKTRAAKGARATPRPAARRATGKPARAAKARPVKARAAKARPVKARAAKARPVKARAATASRAAKVHEAPAPERDPLLAGEAWDGGPMSIVSEVPVAPLPEPSEVAAEPEAERRRETYPGDVAVAVVSAALAATTFLPWYRGSGLSVSAWASGTWGPVVLFLAAGSAALVVLRRAGVAVALPVEESLLHEGVGWVSLAGAVVKSRFRPGVAGQLGIGYGVWVAIGVSVLLIVLAGRMSPRAPLVMRPGWHRGRSGLAGVAVLAIVLAGAGTFGAINSASLVREQSSFPGAVRGRLPDCAKDLPVPEGVRPDFGIDQDGTCQVQLTSQRPASEVAEAFRAGMERAGWTFTLVQQAGGSTVWTVTTPRCATLAVVGGGGGSQGGTLAAFAHSVCATPTR